MTGLLRLYPRWWRLRYGAEVGTLLGSVPRRRGDRLDLIRGALDAWLHPPIPSRIPALSALVGGGLWTAAAAAVIAQPVPPDWPGYLVEVLGVALVSAGFLLVAVVGIAIRGFDRAGRTMCVLAWLTIAAFVAWMISVVGSMSAAVDGPTLAAAQTLAMIATAAVAVALIRFGDERIGSLVLVAAVTMLVPWTWTWLAFGAAWTVIGIALLFERPRRAPMERGRA